jgi:GNAT superfamily N-acetyltransferase
MDIREAGDGDMDAIIAIATATGQEEAQAEGYPAYVRHLMSRGRFLVASAGDSAGKKVTGFGGTLAIGAGPTAISMLTDLFVLPSAHGQGVGRAILTELWRDQPRRMTFSSLHANALPLYASFGVDAWWPLLYFSGPVRALSVPAGFSVATTDAAAVGALELTWTGADRTSDHESWAAEEGGFSLVVSHDGRPVAAGTGSGSRTKYGFHHFVADRAAGEDSAAAVVAALAALEPPGGTANLCLPAPHPATRALLAAGWRIGEFDLHMASEFGLIDPRLTVPSPAMG